MRNSIRSRADSSPPAAGPVLRGILLNGGVGVIVLSLAGLVLTLLAPSQALAVVVVGGQSRCLRHRLQRGARPAKRLANAAAIVARAPSTVLNVPPGRAP